LQRFSGYFFLAKLLDLTFSLNLLTGLHDGLGLPKLMLAQNLAQMLKPISDEEMLRPISCDSLKLIDHIFLAEIRVVWIDI